MMNLQKLFSIYDGVNSQEQEDEKESTDDIYNSVIQQSYSSTQQAQ